MLEGENRYIAFVDALGMSDMARLDDVGFYLALENFYQNVTNSAGLLDENARVHHFSECAYVESSSLESIVTYLQAVRSKLLLYGIYIRGAVGKGTLSPLGGKTTALDNDGKVTGIYFGSDVVPIFRLESSLKGIGLRIDDEHSGDFSKYRVQSFFLPNDGKREIKCFWDLRFVQSDLKDSTFRKFLEDFLIINTTSRRIGRYYVSFLVTWIQSYDLAELSSEQIKAAISGGEDDQIPLVFKLILTGYFEKYFGGLGGLEHIYFSLIDKVMDEAQDTEVRDHFIRFLFGKKKILDKIQFVSDRILSNEHKTEFLQQYSEFAAKRHSHVRLKK